MKQRTINAFVILGLVSLTAILVVQLVWMKKTLDIQARNITIQEKADSLNIREFGEQTNLALKNTIDKIAKNAGSDPDLYGAVRQPAINLFVVDLNDDIQPFYLETLLKKALYNQNIHEDFVFGIYDCFKDSLLFSPIVKFAEDSLYYVSKEPFTEIELLKNQLGKDGHYFAVYFPNVQKRAIQGTVFISPWIYIIIIVVLVIILFAFSLMIMIRQKRLSEVKTDFINNMTHELKTPISTISLSSEMLLRLQENPNIEQIKRYAGIIYKENKRLENQVERVLNVAKLDKDKVQLNQEDIDVRELLLEIQDSFSVSNPSCQLTVNFSTNQNTIHADPLHLTNVLYNLLDNAIKYCNQNPCIQIELRQDKKYLVFDISDNGIGIKRDSLKLIFDKFYRVPTGNVHNVKGFGLGLYYVKLIIEAHGGKVEVKSALDKGTTFSIFLPFEKKD